MYAQPTDSANTELLNITIYYISEEAVI